MLNLKDVLADYSLGEKLNKTSTRPLKIGFVFDDSLDSVDGVAQYVKTLGSWLSSRGHEVTYLVGESHLSDWDGGKVYSLSKNLRIAWGGNRLSMPLWPNRKAIKNVLKEHQFDLLHIQVPYSPFMAQGVIRRVGPETTIVGTFHVFPANKSAFIGARFLKAIYGRSLARFDRMLSVSSAAALFAKQGFSLDCEISSNVVELQKFRDTPVKSRQFANQIIFLGRLVPRKGALQLLKAFLKLKKEVPEAHLTIAGDGPQRHKLEAFVKKNNLSDSVSFLGFIEEAEKPKLLASADIACFPSLYGESFGIVLIEAMAAGAGVVMGGNNLGYKSVLGDRPELLLDPKNSVNVAKKIQALLQDSTLREKLHVWQQAEVKKYDIKTVGEQLLVIYHQAIAKHQSKRHN